MSITDLSVCPTNSVKWLPSAWCCLSIACYLLRMCLVLACQMLDNYLPSNSTKHLTSNDQANVKQSTYAWHLLDNCLVMFVHRLSSTQQANTKHMASKQMSIAGQSPWCTGREICLHGLILVMIQFILMPIPLGLCFICLSMSFCALSNALCWASRSRLSRGASGYASVKALRDAELPDNQIWRHNKSTSC